ncbi:MAG: endonuclease/exonuclease/phosphatase family protein [Akkermansiaceae bacterium]|nr:endonuclease/exonuclease/phosphatase family protein [Akkermansiaceae bacterium]
MAKSKKRGIRRILRVDTLLVALVLSCVYLLTGKFGGEEAQTIWEEVVTPLNTAESAHDFGSTDESAQSQLSDSELNALLGDMPKATQCKPIRFLMMNAHNYFVREDTQRTHYKLTIKKEEARDAVAEVIASAAPEIVGLVEIGGPHALADLQERLRLRGLDYPYSKILLRSGEDRALAVLSMHPIVQDHSRANCNLLGKKRQKMLRGILDVTIQVGENRFYRIMGAHLKSRVSDDPAAATARRTLEARTLAFYLQREIKKQPNMPMLVYGDWNDGPADASLKILKQGVSKDSALSQVKASDSAGQTWTIYYKTGQEYSAFDLIFVNSVLRSRRGRSCDSGIVDIPAAQEASDHRAVWCELR